jgi:hypothetical protein
MTDFNTEWERYVAEGFAPELIPLVEAVYNVAHERPHDRLALKLALVELLSFLVTPEGRTDVNCRATDIFFCVADGWNWEELPQEFVAIMKDIGGTLHDTITAPKVAANFYSLPEQLLERVQKLDIH